MTAMLRIPVQESLLEILKGLGNLETVTAAALRRYALDRCLQRIERSVRLRSMSDATNWITTRSTDVSVPIRHFWISLIETIQCGKPTPPSGPTALRRRKHGGND